jgi:hypothetical protein
MEKIRSLQILVYIVFGLFVLQNASVAFYEGAKEGFTEGFNITNGQDVSKGTLISYVTLDKSLFLNNADTALISGNKYTIQNIHLGADIRINKDFIETPLWFKIVKVVLVLVNVWLLFLIAKTINKVLVMIYKETMFNEPCINLIKEAGVFMLAFSGVDYAYQWLSFAEQSMLIQLPLKVINTSAYNFSIALLAIFIFIIAEVFKQGSKLKEQQNLTI